MKPKCLFEKFDKEKILKIILGTELEFEKISPQIQLFAYFFTLFFEDEENPKEILLRIFRDIFLNLMDGNCKYKIPESIFNIKDEEIQEIFDDFGELIFDMVSDLYNLKEFKNYIIMNYNEISFCIISQLHKSGFNFNFKAPEFNELIDDIANEKVKKVKKVEKLMVKSNLSAFEENEILIRENEFMIN